MDYVFQSKITVAKRVGKKKKKQNSVYLGPEVWGSMVKKYEEILLKKIFF